MHTHTQIPNTRVLTQKASVERKTELPETNCTTTSID